MNSMFVVPIHTDFPLFLPLCVQRPFQEGPPYPPENLLPAVNPSPQRRNTLAEPGTGAGPRRVFPKGALLLFWSHLIQIRTVPEGLCLETFLGGGSEKAKGREVVVAAA